MLSLELDNTSLSGRLLVVNDHEEEQKDDDDSEEENSNIFSHFRSQHLFHGLAVKVYMWMLIADNDGDGVQLAGKVEEMCR